MPFFFFVLGAITASFVGVIVARLNTGQSFFFGRSRCDVCGATLQSLALVPIISYVIGGGKARCCRARISWYAPMAELLLGGLFVGAYLKIGLAPALPFFLLSLALLLALVLYDLSHQILPTAPLFLFIITSAITGFFIQQNSFGSVLIVAFVLALLLALVHFFSRGRAMGFADAPLTFGLALLTGQSAFAGFIFSFCIGAVIGIMILLSRPAGTRIGVEVPFAPFLAAGFILAYFTQWNPFTIVVLL